jgi:hypothetical protein
LIEKSGTKLIPPNQLQDDEVHFAKFEGMFPDFEFSPMAIMSKMKDMNIKEWTITDFDNFLKGNPHV